MVRRRQSWAYYEIRFHSLLYDIWNELDSEVPVHYEKEENPHITIHPRFEFDADDRETFHHIVQRNFPQSITVQVTDFYYYPENDKPMVICLEISTDVDFKGKQKKLYNDVKLEDGQNILEPADPHITLYKSKDKSGGSYRGIPHNVNQIKTRCKKLREEKLPITVSDTELVIEDIS